MNSTNEIKIINKSIKWHISLILICWLSILGFDFFLHAGLLAGLYVQPSSFLLPAEEAFLRIPFGYLSFLILAIFLVWIMERLNINKWQKGIWFGLKFGALLGASSTLGLYSISTIEIDLLLGWWIGQTLELGIAGMVASAGIFGKSLRVLLKWVILFAVIMIIATIILQSFGFAPPMEQMRG
ncbi:hypothetical protein ACFLY8_05475 [Halobacteriota archaeon]